MNVVSTLPNRMIKDFIQDKAIDSFTNIVCKTMKATFKEVDIKKEYYIGNYNIRIRVKGERI